MIYVSLENGRINIQDRQKIYHSLPLIMPLVLVINKACKEMEEIFMGNNVQEQRDFLKKFIEKIIVKDEGIEIIYYAPGSKFPSLTLPSA